MFHANEGSKYGFESEAVKNRLLANYIFFFISGKQMHFFACLFQLQIQILHSRKRQNLEITKFPSLDTTKWQLHHQPTVITNKTATCNHAVWNRSIDDKLCLQINIHLKFFFVCLFLFNTLIFNYKTTSLTHCQVCIIYSALSLC